MIRDGINRDLIECANDVSNKSVEEKKELLLEASQAIEWGAELIAFSGSPIEERSLAVRLSNFAYGIEFRYGDETSEIMLEAAQSLRRLRLMLGLEQELNE
ncbi:hypothetical protein OSJ77_19850 [Phyllobacterium sp. 0TCS1.6C]|uniref:hypothetical protein n=1 Tax=unclassified Phyllobacterium TaxID=2638441 RepID=UPI002263C908|nr:MULTISPECIES: hypothetical protein [unclassified Phyllobacterium]MCX8282448.1 hypothetical protein [Phyllobacterium sp. 0TCS1.6C]MCX8292540.1 hypothetical protein [Phyllobacterium sp. 0TCS1.6A]